MIHKDPNEILSEDRGYVVYCPAEKTFYTGLGWNTQLRTAKIYHSLKMAQGVKEKYEELVLNIFPVSINLIDTHDMG